MKNAEIASVFNSMADLLEIKGENPFRIRAYRNAALSLESLGRDLSGMSGAELLDIPGIGNDLAGKIHEYLASGRIEAFERLRQELPEGLISLLSVPGIGPRTARMLYKEYQVTDIGQLERLAREHQLSKLPGIKEKTESAILRGIEMVRRQRGRYPIGVVLPVAREIQMYLQAHAPMDRIEIAGSIRRWKETIRDIDIICTAKKPADVMHAFTDMPDIKQILMKGTTKSSIVTGDDIQVDLRVIEEESFGAAIAYFTGSKEHNIRLRELAAKAGLKLNEYGIFREADNRKLGGRDEADIYRILGLQYVPPELREDRGEIEAAAKNTLPELLELNDIQGDLHCHSRWSDGNLEIEDLAAIARSRGYAYLAITDHSKGLGVAHGLSEERLMEQIQEIAALNKKMKGLRLLSGTEVNITADGAPDFDDSLLEKLDVVVASIHSGFRQSREQLTGRILKAMNNPHVSIIGHISGRLLGERDSYELDMERILDEAARTGTAVEINAHPLRLDLTDTYARIAMNKGVQVAISTDSHAAGQFDHMRYGVSVARRAWLEKKDVLNTLPAKDLLKRLKKKKKATNKISAFSNDLSSQ